VKRVIRLELYCWIDGANLVMRQSRPCTTQVLFANFDRYLEREPANAGLELKGPRPSKLYQTDFTRSVLFDLYWKAK
jgi:hypothetical protein